VLFAIYKLIVFESRVMGTMFELKTEELGRKGCILWIFVIFTACQILGYERKVTKCVKSGIHGSEINFEQNFYWRTGRKVSISKASV